MLSRLDRVQLLEAAASAVDRQMLVIDCDGVPTAAQISEWERAATAGRQLFIAGPGLNWGWFPGTPGRRPWEHEAGQ